MKQFSTMQNVGKARHVVSFHDGEKTHPDKSPFFDIEIFGNKKKADKFVKGLKESGYAEI